MYCSYILFTAYPGELFPHLNITLFNISFQNHGQEYAAVTASAVMGRFSTQSEKLAAPH